MKHLLFESLISFGQAAKLVPPYRGTKPNANPSTLFRWAYTGVKLPNGERLKLEAIRLGNRWLTSKEALQRFSDTLSAARRPIDDNPLPQGSVRTPSRRLKGSERAAQELGEFGL